MAKPHVNVILQARMSSTRFPGKIIAPLNGMPMVLRQIERIKAASLVDNIIVATSLDESDDVLVRLLKDANIDYFRGSLEDVYDRYRKCIEVHDLRGTLIRLTADCPLVMPKLIDEMIDKFSEIKPDYMSNTLLPTFPDGLDVEICKIDSFIELSHHALTKVEREHVTYGFHSRQNLFKCVNYLSMADYSLERWTVDYPEDLEFIRQIYSFFKGKEVVFDMEDVFELLQNSEIENTIPATMRNVALISGEEVN